MNRDETKLILQSYRPGGRDAGDPQFAAALALVKTDPELAGWFAEQQKFDACVSSGLQQARVPAQLKKEILALQKKTVSPMASPVSIWWRNLFSQQSPIPWALAAVILIIVTLTVFWKKSEVPTRFANYSAQMVSAAVNDPHHVDTAASDLQQASAWFAAHRGENNLVLPTAFTSGKGLMGCRVLDWHGQKVSMLCYQLKDSGHVDIFIAEADIFPDAPPDQPQFASSDGMPTASWTHDGKVYLAVSHGDAAILKNLLSPATSAQLEQKLYCFKGLF